MTPLQAQLIELTFDLDRTETECDGMARLISYRLDRANIPHTAYCGTAIHDRGIISPHFWITCREFAIDYRLRMWLGDFPEVPHGVFIPQKQGIAYSGEPVAMPCNDALYQALIISTSDLLNQLLGDL